MTQLEQSIGQLKDTIAEFEETVPPGSLSEVVNKRVGYSCRLPAATVFILEKIAKRAGSSKGTVGAQLLIASALDAADELLGEVDWEEIKSFCKTQEEVQD